MGDKRRKKRKKHKDRFAMIKWTPPQAETGIFVVKINWRGHKKNSDALVKHCVIDPETETIDLGDFDLVFDHRSIDSIEITPVRRPLLDVEGTIRDARKLANDPRSPVRFRQDEDEVEPEA